MFVNDAAIRLGFSGLSVTFRMPAPTSFFASVGLDLMRAIESASPLIRFWMTSGVLVEELSFHHQQRRDVLALGPQRLLVDEDLAAAFGHERVAHGSGTHAPSIAPDWNAVSETELSSGTMVTSPPSFVSCRPFLFSQVRSATSWVLPAAGVPIFLPLRSAARLIDGLTTKYAPPDAVPATTRMSPFVFWYALIAGFGPTNEASIAPGEQRSRCLATGVERLQLELDVRAQLRRERPVLDADDGRRVGDVGEVAESQRDLGVRTATARGLALRAAAARGEGQRERDGDREGSDDALPGLRSAGPNLHWESSREISTKAVDKIG